nr:cytochrome c-type biogenesis CcmF C-terminal domain-containing protein [Paracoccaceae bacterium]
WAYYELGWGGFWFWDPVENASFMPWLIGTALLHSAIVVEKRNALLKWTILLAILTFALSIMGTFIVRSGILTSVHAFANDPERGIFILLLLCIYIGGALTLFVWRANELEDGGVFALWSRETGLLLNNALLTVATGVVLIGTLYPLALEFATGNKISVGPPFFNATFLPVFAITMLIAGAGPFLSWKRARRNDVLRRVVISLGIAAVSTFAVAYIGGLFEPTGLFGLFVAIWLGVATLADMLRRAGFPKVSVPMMLRRLIGLPASAWGLYLGHGGLAIAAAGVVAVSIWKVETIDIVKFGESIEVGRYEFKLLDVENTAGPNYQTSIAAVQITEDGKPVALVFPERRWYPVEKQSTTEAGIRTLWHGDLYAVLGDPDGAGGFVTRYYYNPGVPWMWLGALMIAGAALISLADRRLRVGAPSARPVPHVQPAE